MTWQHNPDGTVTCDEHPGNPFTPGLQTCPGCDDEVHDPDDHGSAGDLDERKPTAMASADDLWCLEQRDFLTKLAKELAKERKKEKAKDRVGYSTICNLLETAHKFHRTHVEERVRHEEFDRDKWLVEQNRILAGLGGTN